MVKTVTDIEECILFLVAILRDNAYPVRITAELAGQTSRTVAVGAVHSILNRFENEGVLVSFSVRTADNARRKRVYALTEYGRKTKNIPLLPETLKELLRLHHASSGKQTSFQ